MFQVQKQHAIGFQGNIALVRQELKTVDFETTVLKGCGVLCNICYTVEDAISEKMTVNWTLPRF